MLPALNTPYLCTITGIDEHTPFSELVELALWYPFVEFGILYSPSYQDKGGRYPSTEYIFQLLDTLPVHISVALHLCGTGVTQLIAQVSQNPHDLEATEYRLVSRIQDRNGRIQLNFNNSKGNITPEMLQQVFMHFPKVQFITQENSANTLLNAALQSPPNVCNHAILFDISGGRELLSEYWPSHTHTSCGYTGDIGPDNIREQIALIQTQTNHKPYWIDLEGKLRDAADHFDLYTAQDCLEHVLRIISPNPEIPDFSLEES